MSAIKPRTASLVIYQGDDLAQIAELRQAAEVATRRAKGAPNRLGDQPDGQAERDAYDAFVGEAAERAVEVEVRAIGRKRFAELVAEHPPRMVSKETTDDDGVTRTSQEIHPDDAGFDVNTQSFGLALALFADPAGEVRTITRPEFSTRAALVDFLDNDLSDGDFRDLWVTAYYLNRAPSADPKGSLYSPGSPRSTES